MYINTPWGDCVILQTPFVVDFTDETLDIWCTVENVVNCWPIVVLVLINVVVVSGNGDEELKVSKISAYNIKIH